MTRWSRTGLARTAACSGAATAGEGEAAAAAVRQRCVLTPSAAPTGGLYTTMSQIWREIGNGGYLMRKIRLAQFQLRVTYVSRYNPMPV